MAPGSTNHARTGQRVAVDILLALKDRDSRAGVHAARRVVPAAPETSGLRGRTPRCPGASAGTGSSSVTRASPRASTLRAAFRSAWSWCPQFTHRKTAWLSRFSRAT